MTTAVGERLEEALARALELGGAVAVAEELSFVMRVLRRNAMPLTGAGIESMLRELADGVSPYHLLGCYELVVGDTDSLIEVSRHAMPPGTDTRAMLRELGRAAATLEHGTIVDFGCGIGILGIAALRASTGTRSTLIDVDPAACELATRNVERMGFSCRAHVVCADSLGPVDDWDAVRLIVANLPFTPTAEVAALPRRYGVHTPRRATDGGPDGLSVLRPAIRTLEHRARAGTRVLLQLGPGQAATVRDLFGKRWRRLPPLAAGEPRLSGVGGECVVELVLGTAEET